MMTFSHNASDEKEIANIIRSAMIDASNVVARMAYGEYFPEGSKRKFKPTKLCSAKGDLLIQAANAILKEAGVE